MFKWILILLFFFGAASCGNTGNDDEIVSQPPYDRLTDSIRQEPQNAALYYRRGVLLYSNEQWDRSEADLRRAWELNPTEEYALSLTTVLKRKSTDTALLFVRDALKKLPNSIALWIGLARGYQAKGNIAEALKITDDIIARYPGQLDALTLKSELLKDQDHPDAALSYLEKAYALVPSDAGLAYDLAIEYAERKNPKTLSLTDSLIRAKAPEMEKAWYSRGVYYANTGHPAEAYKSFDAAIRANYNFMDAYYDKGVLQYEQKKYAEALKTFELALTISPAKADFYYWLGKTHEAMSKKQEALLNYQRAYGLDKTMKEAKEGMERMKN